MPNATARKIQVATPPPLKLTLDDLARMRSDELSRLYAQGSVPASLSVLDGDHRGRMLAVRFTDNLPIFTLIRRLAASRDFPWEGKSFKAESAHKGTGINRVKLAGRHRLFPFETRIERSSLDGKEAIILDYGSEDNPTLIRHIHDEMREVSPGVFLGPSMWKRDGGLLHLLWFAVDTTAA